MWHKVWADGRADPPQEVGFGPSRERFPLAARRRDPAATDDLDRQHELLRHVRSRRNYLFPGAGIGPLSMAGILVRGVLYNLAVYGTLAVALFVAFLLAEQRLYVPWYGQHVEPIALLPDAGNLGYAVTALGVLGFVSLTALYLLYYARALWAGHGAGVPYPARRRFQVAARATLWLALAGVVVGSHVDVSSWLDVADRALAASGLTLSGVAIGLWSYARSSEKEGRVPLNLLASVGALALTYGALHLCYVAASHYVAALRPDAWPGWEAVALPAAVLVGVVVQLNYSTAHRYYRDRLMETFLPSVPPPEEPGSPASLADSGYLKDMCQYDRGANGPYHLVNTNVVLVNSTITKYAGRGGDSFVLSPLFCGSRATGWRRTASFHPELTLATAMATSGAAVNPNTGAGGKGPTRGYLLSVLMSLLNLRLGFWVRNPNPEHRSPWPFGSNLLIPGLRPYLRRMNERSGHLQLSDGGHFDNLGLYELIRRRVATIVVVDGTADPNFEFSDFGSLSERVRVDFGAQIDIDLTPLTPSVDNERLGRKVSARGHVSGRIRYADGQTAKLVYINTVFPKPDPIVVPEDLFAYAKSHSAFPDQPTGDQFFDEEQFEAYRELGFRLGRRAAAAL